MSEARGIRRLHLGGEAIQSAMRIDEPYALALDYTRCMMAVLLFHPQPREVLMIGLGGGSLAKFFHRRLRAARVCAVELDARVVAAAREHFALPPDNARLKVEIGDGADALAPECCDLLLVDGFDDGEQAPGLVRSAFYDAAWFALAERGAMVLNFMSDDPGLDRYLRRLERAFGGAVLCLPALADPNLLVFAFKGAPRRIAWNALRARAARLEERFALPFRRYVAGLGLMNPHTREDLIIIPDTNGGKR
ncbi:MAG: spermidine synthase [Burkholderiales bacterium]